MGSGRAQQTRCPAWGLHIHSAGILPSVESRSLASHSGPPGILEFHPSPPLPPGPFCSISCSCRKGAQLSLASLPEPFVCWVCRKLQGRWPRAHLPQGPGGGGPDSPDLILGSSRQGWGGRIPREFSFQARNREWGTCGLDWTSLCPRGSSDVFGGGGAQNWRLD